MEEKEQEEKQYVILFSVPTVKDISGLVIGDTEVPFSVLKPNDETKERYALAVTIKSDSIPPFDMVSKSWLKFNMSIMAFEYDEFIEAYNNPESKPTNLYEEFYPKKEE